MTLIDFTVTSTSAFALELHPKNNERFNIFTNSRFNSALIFSQYIVILHYQEPLRTDNGIFNKIFILNLNVLVPFFRSAIFYFRLCVGVHKGNRRNACGSVICVVSFSKKCVLFI